MEEFQVREKNPCFTWLYFRFNNEAFYVTYDKCFIQWINAYSALKLTKMASRTFWVKAANGRKNKVWNSKQSDIHIMLQLVIWRSVSWSTEGRSLGFVCVCDE